MQVTGAIFDCDGTLLDSMDAWLEAQDALAKRVGTCLTEEEVALICTLSIPETGEFFHSRFGLGASPEEVVCLIDEIMLAYYKYRAIARDGALDFVKTLAEQGVKCSVASSTPQALLRVGLESTGFLPYLESVVSVDDVNSSKREPAVYDRACECMGTEKQSTWVFEDSAYALETLLKAGYPTVGVYDNDTAGTYEELSIADVVVRGFTGFDAAVFMRDPYAVQHPVRNGPGK